MQEHALKKIVPKKLNQEKSTSGKGHRDDMLKIYHVGICENKSYFK